MSESERQALDGFKQAAKFLMNPIPARLILMTLPDPLNDLTPDLSLLRFQPLSVLADNPISDASPRENQRPERDSRRSSVPPLEATSPHANSSPIVDSVRSSTDAPIFSMNPVSRRKNGKTEPSLARPKNGRSLNGARDETSSLDYSIFSESPRVNGADSPPMGSSFRTGDRTIDALIDAGLSNQSTWRVKTEAAETRAAGSSGLQRSAAQVNDRAVNPAITSGGLNRTIELIDVLVNRILTQADASAVITQNGMSPSVQMSGSTPNRAIPDLPPLTSIIHAQGDLPDTAESARATYPTLDSASVSLDADTITDLVNQVLAEQARRYGVDLS